MNSSNTNNPSNSSNVLVSTGAKVAVPITSKTPGISRAIAIRWNPETNTREWQGLSGNWYGIVDKNHCMHVIESIALDDEHEAALIKEFL